VEQQANQPRQVALVFVHSACEKNPGPAVVGCLILDGRLEEVASRTEQLFDTTNMKAECMAILRGLRLTRKVTQRQVFCYSNSDVIVRQLKGEFKVKDEGLRELEALIIAEVKRFAKVQFATAGKSNQSMRRVMRMTSRALHKKLGVGKSRTSTEPLSTCV